MTYEQLNWKRKQNLIKTEQKWYNPEKRKR